MDGDHPQSTMQMPSNYYADRDHLDYELTVRQEPKQARMCGLGGKADRRPIDPPPIVQLRVLEKARRHGSISSSSSPSSRPQSTEDPNKSGLSSSSATSGYAQSFLQNPYYFMFASLAKPDDDAELHWLKDGRTRCTTGSVVSSLYHLKDTEHNNEDAGFFVFPDLSVRTEGSYRLKLSLFEVVGNNVRHCKSTFSAPFYVYTAKKFPGMEESTALSCSLAEQGIKIRIRKDIRVRKRPIQALEHPLPMAEDDISDPELPNLHDSRHSYNTATSSTYGSFPAPGESSGTKNTRKRSRVDEWTSPPASYTPYEAGSSLQPGQIPPPPGAQIMPGAQIVPPGAQIIPPPPGAQIIPPPPGATHQGVGGSGVIPPPPGATIIGGPSGGSIASSTTPSNADQSPSPELTQSPQLGQSGQVQQIPPPSEAQYSQPSAGPPPSSPLQQHQLHHQQYVQHGQHHSRAQQIAPTHQPIQTVYPSYNGAWGPTPSAPPASGTPIYDSYGVPVAQHQAYASSHQQLPPGNQPQPQQGYNNYQRYEYYNSPQQPQQYPPFYEQPAPAQVGPSGSSQGLGQGYSASPSSYPEYATFRGTSPQPPSANNTATGNAPQPRGYHPHSHPPHNLQSQPQNQNYAPYAPYPAPPSYQYAQYAPGQNAPPSSASPPPNQPHAYAPWDAYGNSHHNSGPQTGSVPPAPSHQEPSVGGTHDRIQLAPLRGAGGLMSHVQGGYGGRFRGEPGENDRMGSGVHGADRGKKNVLSIGSIISDAK